MLSSISKSIIGLIDAYEDLKKREQKQLIESIKKMPGTNILMFPSKTKKDINNCSISEEDKEQFMKNLRKRADNRWEARVSINKHRYPFYGKTQEECLKKYKEFINSLKLKASDLKKNNLLFKTWMDYWYITYKKPFINQLTASDITRILNNHLVDFYDMPINKITTEYLQVYFNKIPASRTKEKTILYFNACLEKAVNLGKIKKNPFNNFVKEQRIKKIRPSFTYDEQLRILQRLKKEEIEPIILIYLVTGLRKEELDLKNIDKNIDYENKLLKAVNLKQHGKVEYKYIDLTDATMQMIKNNVHIFKKYTTEKVYRCFKSILDELQINGGIHTLRHTFTTNHYYLGTPDKLVSSWLGHSSIVITKDIYQSIDRTMSKEKVLKLYNNLIYQV